MTEHFYLVPNIDSDSVDGARTHKKLISTIHGATLPPTTRCPPRATTVKIRRERERLGFNYLRERERERERSFQVVNGMVVPITARLYVTKGGLRQHYKKSRYKQLFFCSTSKKVTIGAILRRFYLMTLKNGNIATF